MKVLKKDIKKWTQALRSGVYKQTRRQLNDSKGFCCLGVACDLFIPKEKQRKYDGLNAGGLIGELPSDQPSAPKWLKEVNYNFQSKVGASLADFNDGDSLFCKSGQLSFDEIADLIELVYIHEALKEDVNG